MWYAFRVLKQFSNLNGRNEMQKKRMQKRRMQIMPTSNVKARYATRGKNL